MQALVRSRQARHHHRYPARSKHCIVSSQCYARTAKPKLQLGLKRVKLCNAVHKAQRTSMTMGCATQSTFKP